MQNNNARQMYMYKANSSDRPTYNIHFYVYSVQGNVQDKFISPLQNIKTRISKYIFRTKHYISNNYHKLCTSTWRSSHSSLLFYVDSPTCQMHSMDLFKNTKNKTAKTNYWWSTADIVSTSARQVLKFNISYITTKC